MSNKFVSALEKVGSGFKKLLHVAIKEEPLIQALVSVLNPGAGAILATTVGVISQTEQKFAAMGQQSGSGKDKLAEAMLILEPLLRVALGEAGEPAASSKVEGYISAVVAVLNQSSVPQLPA